MITPLNDLFRALVLIREVIPILPRGVDKWVSFAVIAQPMLRVCGLDFARAILSHHCHNIWGIREHFSKKTTDLLLCRLECQPRGNEMAVCRELAFQLHYTGMSGLFLNGKCQKMNVKIADLMATSVMTATPRQTVVHVKKLMADHDVSCFPVVNGDGEPLGIVTTTDLIQHAKETTPIRSIMSKTVYTVPKYSDVSVAARIMRNHHIHHVVVTHEKKVVGIVSSFDLLKLVEDHRFVPKNAPSVPKKGGGKRRKELSDEE